MKPAKPRAPSQETAEDAATRPPPAPDVGRRLNRAFGPIVAGLIIDVVDFATFGPMGLLFGLPVGGLAGYWMGHCLGLSRKGAFLCGLAAGIYCTIPFTEFLPLATLVGAYVRFQESGRPSAPAAAPHTPADTDAPAPPGAADA